MRHGERICWPSRLGSAVQSGACYTSRVTEDSPVADLAVVVVSFNSVDWLRRCIDSLYEHAGDANLDVVVVDNESSDGSAELVELEFPEVRVLRSPNRGFAYGNNRGLETVSAPFVLFLNPDTEISKGTLGEMIVLMQQRPALGLAGCLQVDLFGALTPTIRRFPTATRCLFQSLGSERYPMRASWLGERELDPSVYEHETSCDWIAGSFMLARREAVVGVGSLDERYFMYCEEPDLCLRLKRAGWQVANLPQMTIIHAGNGGTHRSERMVAQDAYARRQYLFKNATRLNRRLTLGALLIGHVLRAAYLTRDPVLRHARRAGSRAAIRALLGRGAPPFATELANSSPLATPLTK